jgi:serine/threonine-protein kinase
MATGSNDIMARALALFERALDQPRQERAAWIKSQTRHEAKLQKKALSYLSRDKTDNIAFQTGGAFHDTLGDTAVPDQIGAYKIMGLIGRGGMGAVYRGQRASGDFDHDVAIKIVRPGAMSDKLVARFEAERQTLASLSHPNIARLFDGGTLESGAPYIVMEYIDGLPITEFAENNKLSKQETITLFKAVCDAVSHAHQNLIIHRDITPSNVLVDQDGQVKLIDFGIAKPFDEDAASIDTENSLASLSFTPGFAAPERSKGAGANTLSDIYSLGKLLNSLMKNAHQTMEMQSIIDKATSLEPINRYRTVNALHSDIDNYLGGFPIDAIDKTSGYKLKKFMGRHKIGSLLATTSVLGLFAAFAITLFQYQRAETARLEASNRFEEVRDLAKFQLFELYDDLEKIPGNTKSLSSIADKSKTYLDALSQDKQASLELQLETAIGYKRLSDVMGNPLGANLGRRKDAAILIKKAHDDLSALHTKAPDNTAITRALADASFSFAVFEFIAEDNSEKSIIYAQKSAELYSEIIDGGQATDIDEINKIKSSLQAAKPLLWIGKGGEGIEALRKLRDEILVYTQAHPDNLAAKKLNGNIHSELADTMAWHFDDVGGDYHEAIPFMDYALKIYEEIVAKNKDDYAIRRSLAASYYKRAQIYMGLDDDLKILADMEIARGYAQALLDIDPNDLSAARIVKVVEGEMAMILASLGRADEAIKLGEKALKEARKSLESDPDNAGYFRDYTNRLYTFADVMNTLGRKKDACRLQRQSMDNWNIIEERWGLSDLDKKNAIKDIKAGLAKCD